MESDKHHKSDEYLQIACCEDFQFNKLLFDWYLH